MKRWSLAFCIGALAISGVLCAALEGAVAKSFSVETITRPNYDAKLSVPIQGRISKISVKAGQCVKKGDLLVQLDDSAEQVRLAQLKAISEDRTKILAAEVELAQKILDLQRVKQLAQTNTATQMELEHAQLEVKIQELSLKMTKFEHVQAHQQYAEMAKQVVRMKILAPCDGIVEELFAEEGESVDLSRPVLRLVNIKPLWADVPVRTTKTAKLKVGHMATVRFRDGTTSQGTIAHIASVADSASETRKVRVSIPNPSSQAAGTRVTVTFAS